MSARHPISPCVETRKYFEFIALQKRMFRMSLVRICLGLQTRYADCRSLSMPCWLTNTGHIAAKSIKMSGSRIRPARPDIHASKHGMKVATSTSRYGDKRVGST